MLGVKHNKLRSVTVICEPVNSLEHKRNKTPEYKFGLILLIL